MWPVGRRGIGDTDRRRDRLTVGIGQPARLDRGAQPFGDLQGPFASRIAQEHEKFFPAEAAGDVGTADVVGDDTPDLRQGAVAALMAEQVVDRLEVVDIEEQHGAGAPAAHALHGIFERARHTATVRQTGQRVDRGGAASRSDRAVFSQQRTDLVCRAREFAFGDLHGRPQRAIDDQRAAQTAFSVARRKRGHGAVVMNFGRVVVAGDLNLEQDPSPKMLQLGRHGRPEPHDARPAIGSGAAEGVDLHGFAHDARVDALEQRAHLRLRIARPQHRIDRLARKRQTVQACVETRQTDEGHGQHDQRREHRQAEKRSIVERRAGDHVGPGRFDDGGQHRPAIGKVADPDPQQRAALTQGEQRIDPQ